jgi:hypothetical protein
MRTTRSAAAIAAGVTLAVADTRTRSATSAVDDASVCNIGRCTRGVRSNRTGCARGLLPIGEWSQGAAGYPQVAAPGLRTFATRLTSCKYLLVLDRHGPNDPLGGWRIDGEVRGADWARPHR